MSEQEINNLMESMAFIYIKTDEAYNLVGALSKGNYYFTIGSNNYQFILDEDLGQNDQILYESYINTLYKIKDGLKTELNVSNGTTGTQITLQSGVYMGLNDPAPESPYGLGKYEQDLDSGRDMDGIVIRNVLDHHPHKIFLNMPYGMNRKQMARFLHLVDQSTLYVNSWNPWKADMDTTVMKMMHGDLVPEVDFFYYDYDKQDIDCKYNAISVEIVEY